MAPKKFKDHSRRIAELQTMKILTSVEECMIVHNLIEHDNKYAPVVKEMKGIVTLINKGLVTDEGEKLLLNPKLRLMLNMELNTQAQHLKYNGILTELTQMVNGGK